MRTVAEKIINEIAGVAGRVAARDPAQGPHRAAGMHGYAGSCDQITDGVGKLVNVDGVTVDLDSTVDGLGGWASQVFDHVGGGRDESRPAQRDLVRAKDPGRGVDRALQSYPGGEIRRRQVTAGQPGIPAQPVEGMRVAREQHLPAA